MATTPAPTDPPAQPEPPTPAGPPLVPTPRLRFVRWLIQTGRLSEWPDAPHAGGVEREHALARGAHTPGPLA